MYLSVSLPPPRSRERSVASPRFFYQHKELCLATCTNCLTSSLLERQVVNAPFAFRSGLNVRRTNHARYSVHCTLYRSLLLNYEEPVREWVPVFAKHYAFLNGMVNCRSIHNWVYFVGPSRPLR